MTPNTMTPTTSSPRCHPYDVTVTVGDDNNDDREVLSPSSATTDDDVTDDSEDDSHMKKNNVITSSSPTAVVLSSTLTGKVMSSLHLASTIQETKAKNTVINTSNEMNQQQQQQQQKQQRPISKQQHQWPIFQMSQKASRTQNPIRAILDPILLSTTTTTTTEASATITDGNENSTNMKTKKSQISLALGDPTTSYDTKSNNSAITTQPLVPCPHGLRAIYNEFHNLIKKDDDAADTTTSASNTLKGSTTTVSYTNAIGTQEGRIAIAHYHSHPYYTYNANQDIIITNGCSGAIELVLSALLNDNNTTITASTSYTTHSSNHQNNILLVPSPGFPLYRVIAESIGASVLYYPLLSNQQWEIDIQTLRNMIEETLQQQTLGRIIRGMVINNPSNPTGAVYSKQHLQDIITICHEYCIPIIADEIYGDMIFTKPIQMLVPSTSDTNNSDWRSPTPNDDCHHHHYNSNQNNIIQFIPMAQVAGEMHRTVPVITVSGIGKQFLLPGWRIGWICFQDNIYGSIQQIRDGAKRLAQVILGASHLAQIAIPALLMKEPLNHDDDGYTNSEEYCRSYIELMEWKYNVHNTLYEQAVVICHLLQLIGPCLHVIVPQGAMYVMIHINVPMFDNTKIQNDIDFMKLLYMEENVIVLPGTCFHLPNTFRIVFCAPIVVLQEAAKRIHQFCHRHLRH